VTDKTPHRNVAVALVLIATYAVPAFFIDPQTMLDIISVPMLVFGGWAFTSSSWRHGRLSRLESKAALLWGCLASSCFS